MKEQGTQTSAFGASSKDQSPDDSIQKKNRKLSKYIGAGKGIFGSPKEVDKFIRKQRKEWD